MEFEFLMVGYDTMWSSAVFYILGCLSVYYIVEKEYWHKNVTYNFMLTSCEAHEYFKHFYIVLNSVYRQRCDVHISYSLGLLKLLEVVQKNQNEHVVYFS